MVKILGNEHKYAESSKVEIPGGNDWVIEGAKLFTSCLGTAGVIYGMNVAWTTWMLRQGRIGEAALVRLVGYPRWFKFARAGAAIIITFGFEAIIDAITGSEQRDELQKAIRECITPRANLCKAFNQNKILIKSLDRFITRIETIQEIKGDDFTDEVMIKEDSEPIFIELLEN